MQALTVALVPIRRRTAVPARRPGQARDQRGRSADHVLGREVQRALRDLDEGTLGVQVDAWERRLLVDRDRGLCMRELGRDAEEQRDERAGQQKAPEQA